MRIMFAPDNESWGTPIDLADVYTDMQDPKPHFPRRVGVNARARTMSICIDVTAIGAAIDTEYPNIWNDFEISDMRMLWAYTQRGPHNKNALQNP